MAEILSKAAGSRPGYSLSYEELAQVAHAARMGNPAAAIALSKLPATEARLALMVAGEFAAKGSYEAATLSRAVSKVSSPAKKKAKAKKSSRYACARCGGGLGWEYANCPRCTPPVIKGTPLTCATCDQRPEACYCYRPRPARRQQASFSSNAYRSAANAYPAGSRLIEKRRRAGDRKVVQDEIRRDFLQPWDPGRRAIAEQALPRDALGTYQATLMRSDPIRARCAAKYGVSIDDLVGPSC